MASRNHRREYERRSELARLRGFGSYAEQRRAGRQPRNAADLGRLPPAARDARTDALRTIRTARERGITIEEAAREQGVAVEAAGWWAADAIGPKRGGSTLPQSGDRLLRLRPVVVEGGGVEFIEIRGSKAAARAEEAFNIQWDFVEGRATVEDLERIRGVRVGGHSLESDAANFRLIAAAGDLDIPEAYRDALR